MENSKKGKLQLSRVTLSSLSGGRYKFSKYLKEKGFKGGKGTTNGEIYPKVGLSKGKFQMKGLDYMIPTFGNLCITQTF